MPRIYQMANPIVTQRWTYWSILVAISLVILFVKILPLNVAAGRWPGPDWLIAFAFAWVLRRPDYTPALLIAALLLLSDFVFMRPPGLSTALGVIGLEFLRTRSQFSRDLPFIIEWAMVGGVLAAISLTTRVVLAVFVVSQPSFGLDMIQLTATVLFYPVIVAISTYVLGVRKVALGEVDQLGHRI